MSSLWNVLWPAGLWANPDVRAAAIIGTVVAVGCAVAGVFVIIRGQAFSSHALGDVGATGASGAFLLGVGALWGFLAAGLVTGLAIESLGKRIRERDLATGVVLAFMLGLSALFLYLISARTGVTNAPIAILFGSLFTVNPALVPVIGLLTAIELGLVALIYRRLLFATIAPEGAQIRGARPRLVTWLFMLVTIIAVEEAALVVGAVLSTALVVGPAATAVLLSRRPNYAIVLAVGIGIAQTWLGIVLAYDSYLWPPVNRGWPVSFFITSLTLLTYLAALFAQWLLRRRRQSSRARRPEAAFGAGGTAS